MFLTELDVVNACIGSLGEAPLNSLDEDHDLVAQARNVFKKQSFQVQSVGWWFNKESVQLLPDPVSGYIMVPNDCASLDHRSKNPQVTIRGRRLYQPYAGPDQDPYKFDKPLTINYIRVVPFDELPPTAQVYISARTVLRFQTTFDGDELKTRQLTDEEREAFIFFNTEHIRNVRANLLGTQHAQVALAAVRPEAPRGNVYVGAPLGGR